MNIIISLPLSPPRYSPLTLINTAQIKLQILAPISLHMYYRHCMVSN